MSRIFIPYLLLARNNILGLKILYVIDETDSVVENYEINFIFLKSIETSRILIPLLVD